MIARRAWLVAAALLTGCGKRSARQNLLPEAVGQWRRTSLDEQPVSGVPRPLTPATVKRVQTAVYEGAGRLEVTLYELANSANALDAVQRWRPAADSIFFYKDEYFAVVHYQRADRQALNAFVRDLSQHLAPPK